MRLLVLLHGFGDDPARLGDLAATFDPAHGATPVLVPRGRFERDGGPSWLPDDHPEPDTVTAAVAELTLVIDAECARLGCERSEAVLGGFSQGGAMALAMALAGDGGPPFAACFVIAGFLWPPTAVDYDFARAVGTTPVLVVHGDEDGAVPVQQGRSAARVLERQGVAVAYREVEGGGHDLDPRYADAVRGWLREQA